MTGRLRATAALLAFAAISSTCTSKPEPATPVSGGTLRVAVRDLSSLDPAKATGRGATFVLAQVFRPLTTVDARGTPQAGAATSWTATPDGRRWDFKLGPGTFHDGSTVTASDFKVAFDRIVQKALNSDAAFQLESVRGFREAKVLGSARTLTGVTAPDPATVRIELTQSFAELPRFLAHPALGPVRGASLAAADAFGAKPVGNGPFAVAEPKTATGVSLKRFDGYPGKKAYLDGVRVEVRTDADTVWEDITNGRLDIGEVPTRRIDEARKRFGEAGYTPFWAATYYGLNLRSSKYARPEVRRALSLAIDRTALAKTVYGGSKDPAGGLVPNGIPGAGIAACDACTFDRARARSLLNEVFKGRPPEFTIDHLEASPSNEVARAVAAQLQEAGLRVSLRAHSSSEYLALLKSGKQDIAELGWLSDVPSPDQFLAQQLRTGSVNNQTGLRDRTFDSAIDRARSASDDAVRTAAYADAEKRALELMPLIPLVFFRNHLAARRTVHGFRVDGAGIFDASAVWISRG